MFTTSTRSTFIFRNVMEFLMSLKVLGCVVNAFIHQVNQFHVSFVRIEAVPSKRLQMTDGLMSYVGYGYLKWCLLIWHSLNLWKASTELPQPGWFSIQVNMLIFSHKWTCGNALFIIVDLTFIIMDTSLPILLPWHVEWVFTSYLSYTANIYILFVLYHTVNASWKELSYQG